MTGNQIAISFVGIFIVCALFFRGGDKPSSASTSSNPAPLASETNHNPGDRVTLSCGDGDGAVVATSAEAFNEMAEGARAKDSIGFVNMLETGRLIYLKGTTSATYLEGDYDACIVRLNDGPAVGARVWAIPANLRR